MPPVASRPSQSPSGFPRDSPCGSPRVLPRIHMFSGSIVALVTPMQTDGAVDFAAMERLVDFHVDNGTSAIVAVGTTGESPTLTVVEHIEVVRRVIQRSAKRIPVIAGTGGNSTVEAIELTRLAKEAGA